MWQVINALALPVLIIGLIAVIFLLILALVFLARDKPSRKRFNRTGIITLIILVITIAPSVAAHFFTPLPFLLPSGQVQCVAGQVTISGSTAMQPLLQDIAHDYMNRCSQASITVNGSGSDQGLKDVEGNAAQIGASDVFRTELFAPDTYTDLDDYVVAAVPYVLIVSKAPQEPLDITDLSSDQVQAIFTGSETNWSDLGGPDLRITAISREPGSGTRRTFEKYILQGNQEKTDPAGVQNGFYPTALTTNDVVTYMTKPGAIGYVTAFEYRCLVSDDPPASCNLKQQCAPTCNLKSVAINTVTIDGHRYDQDYHDNSYTFWNLEHLFIKDASATDTSLASYRLALAFINYMGSASVEELISNHAFINWTNISGIWSTHAPG